MLENHEQWRRENVFRLFVPASTPKDGECPATDRGQLNSWYHKMVAKRGCSEIIGLVERCLCENVVIQRGYCQRYRVKIMLNFTAAARLNKLRGRQVRPTRYAPARVQEPNFTAL